MQNPIFGVNGIKWTIMMEKRALIAMSGGFPVEIGWLGLYWGHDETLR
jgi:hypothetical protein